MAKFKKKTNTSQEIPTAALPDIIFMLLFFFMVTTVMRKSNMLVEQNLPKATQLQKLEQKSLVSYIYVGKPKDIEQYGDEPRIQLNDALAVPDQIPRWVIEEKEKLNEQAELITISIKGDVGVRGTREGTEMGIIIDIKEKLRDANALKVNYSTGLRVE
ncbi:MAG: biopolymer transporter ExbD [Bacteroidota bacterium]